MKSAFKITNREIAGETCDKWRREGHRIVFTNGCFDLLHQGHVQYLEQAAGFGDRLVVGINSDASTRRLKGSHRPVNSEQSRAFVMASLSCVDLVVIFEEDTPLELIRHLKPDVLVKGGDYAEDEIAGADFVKTRGGHVEIVPFAEGFSTTEIEQRIIDLHNSSNKE